MSTQHQEFPDFTPETKAAFNAALKAITSTTATLSVADFRRALAASLLEAMRQSDPVALGGRWGHLEAIANNLHSPPPTPPTLAQAREAARQLAGADAEIVHAFLASLGEGEA